MILYFKKHARGKLVNFSLVLEFESGLGFNQNQTAPCSAFPCVALENTPVVQYGWLHSHCFVKLHPQ